ncbi:hypothetical protein SUGI_1021710 [Cryptomeria japonica]|nr:hypothetical protein SUGI_1021710 [Cryptomeria japonica]
MYVPRGTSGVCVMQVFGAVKHATTLMLLVSNGNLRHHNDQVVARRQWLMTGGLAHHYFKCGVYGNNNASSCMESRWKNIKLWTK